MEELQADSQLIGLLIEHFKSIKYYPVLLCPKSKEKAGAVENRWKGDVNIKLYGLKKAPQSIERPILT